jgi:hypothetical protein
VKSRYLCLLLLCCCSSAWSQDRGAEPGPPGQSDGSPQAPAEDKAQQPAPPQPASPPQGGDFSNNWDAPKLPTGVILVKGAWASASDSITPLPEGGAITDKVYKNDYFGLSYALPADFVQKFTGPPPSDAGSYVLLQLRPAETFKGATKGIVLVTAQDLFFSLVPGKNAQEMINYSARSLRSDYTLERAPTEVTIANRPFVRMDYVAPVAGLHWFVLATEIRCHALEFVFTSRDPELLESLIQALNKMKLPEEAGPMGGIGGGGVPVCIKNYASGPNVLTRVEPVLPQREYNTIPVRIIIGKSGKVKHVHMISALPDQAKIITDALLEWEFKPYMVNGEPVEVETGILFGLRPPNQKKPATAKQPSAVAD